MGRAWPSPREVLRRVSVVLALVLVATPASAQPSIPESQELAIGRTVAAQLIAEYGLVGDAEWLGFLSGLRDRLLPFSGRPGIPYQVGILNHTVPNAASTPGWLFVTAGLVHLRPEVDAWAFVLAHEIAHIARRHVAQHVARAQAGQLASILVAILTGSRAAGDVVGLLVQLSTLGFSRELELEADREALRMLVEAGFDPQAASRTLSWFNEVTGRRQERTHWTGTHPGFLDRVAAVQRAYEEFGARGLPLRVRHFRIRYEVGPVVLVPERLVELRDAWNLHLLVENRGERPAGVQSMNAVLVGPDGEVRVRFLRSTLPEEVPAQGRVQGVLAFEKKSSRWPEALVVPVRVGEERGEARVDLTSGGPYTPPSAPPSLPRPPSLP
ncbi:MAG: M48 family metallopeptidase [Armatimonadetes bacterium]|nr:M48 family metallopeptidase [Armatimonadota bacterium]MDW8154718.1 M48 family metallopeptidase [Armatimonadota bacterium]